MQLSLKKSFNNWIEVGENDDKSKVKFKLDYPSREQEQELQSIKYGDKFTGGDISLKYAQRFLKYVIKDWEGVSDQDGNKVECKLKQNELEDEIWWALVGNEAMAMSLFVKCYEELEFTGNDKKKLSSLLSSQETASSQEEEKNTQ